MGTLKRLQKLVRTKKASIHSLDDIKHVLAPLSKYKSLIAGFSLQYVLRTSQQYRSKGLQKVKTDSFRQKTTLLLFLRYISILNYWDDKVLFKLARRMGDLKHIRRHYTSVLQCFNYDLSYFESWEKIGYSHFNSLCLVPMCLSTTYPCIYSHCFIFVCLKVRYLYRFSL